MEVVTTSSSVGRILNTPSSRVLGKLPLNQGEQKRIFQKILDITFIPSLGQGELSFAQERVPWGKEGNGRGARYCF